MQIASIQSQSRFDLERPCEFEEAEQISPELKPFTVHHYGMAGVVITPHVREADVAIVCSLSVFERALDEIRRSSWQDLQDRNCRLAEIERVVHKFFVRGKVILSRS